MTSVERFVLGRGMQHGLEQGRLEGRQEGETSLLERLLVKCFGPFAASNPRAWCRPIPANWNAGPHVYLAAPILDAVFGVDHPSVAPGKAWKERKIANG
ncbi:hypothetical protein CKO23_22270 [Thiocystis violacea]|nr:hypothetical protein [Thiocystis violacea]